MTAAARATRLLLPLVVVLLLGGCAILKEFGPSVEARALSPGEYIAMKRGDILTTGSLSAATAETIRVAGLDTGACSGPSAECMQALAAAPGLTDERRLAALAELWVQQAIALTTETPRGSDAQIDAWLEAARHAYAYLFFSERRPGERAFEDRQTQVRDYYNHAVEQGAIGLFQRAAEDVGVLDADGVARVAGWTLETDLSGVRMPEGVRLPEELVPAASLDFSGLRSVYRRDGFGAELVAVMDRDPMTAARAPPTNDPRARRGTVFSEMPSPALTALFRFPGEDLAQVMAARDVLVSVHDPYRESAIELHGLRVPLAANYTAGYGLWLARSGFSRQSLQTLFGRGDGIDRAHLYLMQPYDPERRIIVMVHGLASSPEAWVNVANEILGDETLRQHFQVWQVYYPTNLPIAVNHASLRRALTETLRNFDPAGTAPASRDMVVIGHSMGGVLSRLLVSSSGDSLWQELVASREIGEDRLARVRRRLEPMLRFEPFPGVERVIFIAAPHRGTDIAGGRLGRLFSRLVRLPLTVLEGFDDVLRDLTGADESGRHKPPSVPNSIDNLSRDDPFVLAAATLPIPPRVRYHTIIAQRDPALPLAASNDGLVPYCSAHLAGAVSEKVIESGHSVQETAEAILEIRRILHEDLAGGDVRAPARVAAAGACGAQARKRSSAALNPTADSMLTM